MSGGHFIRTSWGDRIQYTLTLVVCSLQIAFACVRQSNDHEVAMKWYDLSRRTLAHLAWSAKWLGRSGPMNERTLLQWHCGRSSQPRSPPEVSQHHSHDRHSDALSSVASSSLLLRICYVTKIQGSCCESLWVSFGTLALNYERTWAVQGSASWLLVAAILRRELRRAGTPTSTLTNVPVKECITEVIEWYSTYHRKAVRFYTRKNMSPIPTLKNRSCRNVDLGHFPRVSSVIADRFQAASIER